MTWYADLTPYAYRTTQQPMVNVGWLGDGHPVPTGEQGDGLAAALLKLAELHLTAIMRGVHDCQFCLVESPVRVEAAAAERGHVWLGTGEIRVERDGIVYSAPSLVHHYVHAHGYSPPMPFQQAVLEAAGDLTGWTPEPPPCRSPLLVLWDYGMGGLWAYVDAASPEAVRTKYPEVVVYETRPPFLSSATLAKIEQEPHLELDGPPTGLFAAVVAARGHR